MARLDPSLHAALSDAAEELDWSTNSALNEAVRGWLERRDFDSARLDSPDHPEYDAVELRPMTEPGKFRVAVDGYAVPYLTASRVDPPQGTSLTGHDALGWHVLTLDDRYQTKAMSWGELWPMCWFMANAMAISAGYTSHGQNGYRRNVHGPSEPLADLAAWAEHGWTVHQASGSSGKGYELTLTFTLPHMSDGDLRCYTLRDAIVDLLDKAGVRDPVTRLIALAPLQESPTAERP
jgi:hypothetical protein